MVHMVTTTVKNQPFVYYMWQQLICIAFYFDVGNKLFTTDSTGVCVALLFSQKPIPNKKAILPALVLKPLNDSLQVQFV